MDDMEEDILLPPDLFVTGADKSIWFHQLGAPLNEEYAAYRVLSSKFPLFTQRDICLPHYDWRRHEDTETSGWLAPLPEAISKFRSLLQALVPDEAFSPKFIQDNANTHTWSVTVVIVQGQASPVVSHYHPPSDNKTDGHQIIVQFGALLPLSRKDIGMKICSELAKESYINEGYYEKGYGYGWGPEEVEFMKVSRKKLLEGIREYVQELYPVFDERIWWQSCDQRAFELVYPNSSWPSWLTQDEVELLRAMESIIHKVDNMPEHSSYCWRIRNITESLLEKYLGPHKRDIASEVIRAHLSANLRGIKARLWRPDGPLVARMMEAR